MATVQEVTPASELKQEPPPFVPSTEGLPPPMDDKTVRAIFEEAARMGVDDLDQVMDMSAQPGQPISVPSVQATAPIPEKFQKPDGTVDEEKLKTSTAQLETAVQSKQKTVEDLLADYRAKEKELGELGAKQGEIKQNMTQLASTPPATAPTSPQVPFTDPNAENIRQQLLQLQRNDPIAFAVEIARAVAQKEAQDASAPFAKFMQTEVEKQRDGNLRSNIAAIAESDPRILDPQIYAEFQKELNGDPGYFRLKNPHKAAFNEVKERLRLGEPPTRQAPPSNPSPILGRGLPTPIQGLNSVQTPTSMNNQVSSVDPLSEEGKRFEAQLRQASEAVWRV